MLSETQTFDPYALPPFANEANRALAQKIKEKEKALNLVQFQYEDNSSRSNAMVNHIKSIRQEMGQTQALYEAKSRQLEAESNFKKLASRQAARLLKEIQSLDQDIQSINDQMNAVQTNMYKGTEKLDEFRSDMKLSKAQLDELLRLEQEKEEDQDVIAKYAKEDEMKLKELNMQIEKANAELIRLKSNMDAEVTNSQVTQLELNQTTEQFRQTHREREDLLEQWTQILQKIQKRDNSIQSAEEALVDIQESTRGKKEIIEEKQVFLNQQEEEVEEKSKEIILLEANLAKFRSQQLEETQTLQEYQDQLYVMRNEVYKSSADLQNKQNELKRLEAMYSNKLKTLENTKIKLEENKLNLEKMASDKTSLEIKAKELERVMDMEENKSKQLEKELKAIKDVLFKKTQELSKLKQDERNMTSEVSSGQANIRMIRSKINQLEQDMLKQKAIIYAQDFQIEQLDKKVRRAQGERSDEEKEQLEATMKELTSKFEDQTKMGQLLTTQLKKSQDDLRIAKRREENLKKEKDQVIANMNDVTLYLDGIQKQVTQQTKNKGESMVEEGLLRLEVRKLREVLNSRADGVFSLESKKLQLNAALEERNKEISIQKDLLRLQYKQAEEERSSAAAELRDRVKKVENLKKRYEILMSQFSHADDDGSGQEHTQAYFIIKAAQKKELLQKEGDDLDKKIKKAEAEVKELENTLKFMTDHNDEYRAYLVKSELNSRDIQHKEMLEQQYTMVMEKYKTRRQDYQTLNVQVNEVETQLNLVNSRESNLIQAVTILEKKLRMLETDVTEQNEKKTRALRSVHKSLKDLKLAGESATPEDLNVRFLKDQINIALMEIAKISEEHSDIAYLVYDLIQKYNMSIPSQPISRINSRPETARDDQSSSDRSFRIASKTSSRAGSHIDLRASANSLATRSFISAKQVSLEASQTIPRSISQANSQASSARSSIHRSSAANIAALKSTASSRKPSVSGSMIPKAVPGSGKQTPKGSGSQIDLTLSAKQMKK